MEQIVLARDDFDRPLHPLLHDLYAWAAGGDFAIYIEMPEPASVSPYKAAECVRDRTARNSANQPTLVVRLYTRVIDQARIDGRTRAFDGFVPFVGLTREERYCESLAHELAHARDLLTNPECARLLQEQEELNVQFLQLVQARGRDEPQRQKRLALVRLLGDLGEKIEKPAIEVEQQVWRELSATRRLRSAPR